MAPLATLEIAVDRKDYASAERTEGRAVLNDLRLKVPGGQFLCLLGPSGCGKTTLLNIVAGLDTDFDGRINWTGPAGSVVSAPQRIGYVFQEPRLLPWLTVAENIDLVLQTSERDPDFLAHLVEVAGLSEHRQTYPQRLSLGLARRVALVRAFAVKPDLLLMDEPFVSLDGPTAERLRGLLLRIWSERPTTVVFVTHDSNEALRLADRIVQLSTAPARVVADVEVPMPREARREAAALEALRQRLGADLSLLSSH